MRLSIRTAAALAIVLLSAGPVAAQATYRPTPAPQVGAENESWYLAGEPVVFGGNIYYPSGPRVHFNGNEMVQSGLFHSTPLYTRTTIETNSIVYVPLTGGLMQPYERKRSGDLAGTVGSSAPSFPVARSSESAPQSAVAQAPAAPTIVSAFGFTPPAAAEVSAAPPAGAAAVDQPRAVGTTGRPAAERPAAAALRPKGDNALFIEFNGRRWFSAGTTIPLDRSRMTRIGEHRGFDVYADAAGDPESIFVPVSRDVADFVARYTARRPR